MSRWILALAVALHGCGGWGEIECVDDGDCAGIAVCDARSSQCKDVECTSSEQCALGSHCDDATNACVGGCGSDEDCIAGEICNFDGQCEPYGCRTTELDCHYGENCVSGECVDDTDPHCLPASTLTAQTTCTAAGGTVACFDYPTCAQLHCLLPCTPATTDPCPRGLSCIQPFDPTQNDDFYCSGACPFLLENGF